MIMTFKETRRLIGTDYQRFLKHYGLTDSFKNVINVYLTNSMMAVVLYRWSHYFYSKRLRIIARLIFLFNLTLTGAELLPQSKVGDGFLLIHTVASGIDCVIGNNVTIYGRTCIGSNPGDATDVGAGPSLPLLGNNVVCGLACHILGPVKIGDNVVIGPGAMVMKSVPEGSVVYPPIPRILSAKEKLI